MLALRRENKVAFYNRQIRNSKNAVLQYDPDADNLCVWKWYDGPV
jgi:hypothetical protein